jgi:neutral ceramidase
MKTPVLTTCLSLALTFAASAQTVWKAGAAKTVVTPSEPIWLAGYGDRTHPSQGVLRDIYVKALALEAEPGRPVVIVTGDLLGFSREISDPVAVRCEKEFGLPRDRLELNASHTHSAPVVHRNAFPIFNLEEKQWQAVDRYSTFLIDKTVGVIGAALHDLAPAKVKFGQSFAGIAVNRRRAYPGGRNRTGQVDPDVPVITVEAADGALRAILVGYACHATVLNIYQVSGDWPGFAQEAIEKQHPGAIALFVQGAGADANPLPRRSVELARAYGEVLAAAVEDVLKAPMKPVEGPIRSASEIVQVPFHHVPTREELLAQSPPPRQRFDITENFGAYDGLLKTPRPRNARYLDILDRGGKLPEYYPYRVEVWQFGGSLKFIALSGEVVSDYSIRLKGQYGWEDTWVAGYSNDYFGYTPSARVLHEGGYEAIQSGYVSQFSPAIEELIVEKVADLMARTGAPAGHK